MGTARRKDSVGPAAVATAASEGCSGTAVAAAAAPIGGALQRLLAAATAAEQPLAACKGHRCRGHRLANGARGIQTWSTENSEKQGSWEWRSAESKCAGRRGRAIFDSSRPNSLHGRRIGAPLCAASGTWFRSWLADRDACANKSYRQQLTRGAVGRAVACRPLSQCTRTVCVCAGNSAACRPPPKKNLVCRLWFRRACRFPYFLGTLAASGKQWHFCSGQGLWPAP